MLPRDGLLSAQAAANASKAPARPLVYMYEHPALDHVWLHECESFRRMRRSSDNDNLAEVGMRKAMLHSELRVRDPSKAQLFYVPVFEFASSNMGACGNSTSHMARMNAAHAALEASPWWQRHRGRDHLMASSAWSFGMGSHSLRARVGALRHSMGSGVVGRYKAGRYASGIGSCVIGVPWASSLWLHRTGGHAHDVSAGAATAARENHRRPLLLHFAGSLDVCCTGATVRCAVGPLAAAAWGVDDVLIRFMRPTNASLAKPCTRRAAELLAQAELRHGADANRSLDRLVELSGWRAAAPASPAVGSTAPPRASGKGDDGGASGRYADVGLAQLTMMEMRLSTFCLMPAGDNGMRSLLYSAVAAGCIPVILCDRLRPTDMPFSSHVPWAELWVKASDGAFIRDASSVIRQLRAINASEVRHKQRLIARHRLDVLYEEAGSRAGTNFVLDAANTRCIRSLLNATSSSTTTRIGDEGG